MKLFLISQDKNEGYDTYDSAVVVAESEKEAREVLHEEEVFLDIEISGVQKLDAVFRVIDLRFRIVRLVRVVMRRLEHIDAVSLILQDTRKQCDRDPWNQHQWQVGIDNKNAKIFLSLHHSTCQDSPTMRLMQRRPQLNSAPMALQAGFIEFPRVRSRFDPGSACGRSG